MNIEKIQDQINDLQKQLDELKGDKVDKPWKPIFREKYYYVGEYYDVVMDYWHDMEYNNFRYSQCNCFKTEAEAQQHIENLKTKAELLDLARQYPVDWSDEDQIKRHFIYDYLGGELDWPSDSIFRAQGTIYLTEIGIDKALEQIGEARLIKLIKSGI